MNPSSTITSSIIHVSQKCAYSTLVSYERRGLAESCHKRRVNLPAAPLLRCQKRSDSTRRVRPPPTRLANSPRSGEPRCERLHRGEQVCGVINEKKEGIRITGLGGDRGLVPLTGCRVLLRSARAASRLSFLIFSRSRSSSRQVSPDGNRSAESKAFSVRIEARPRRRSMRSEKLRRK